MFRGTTSPAWLTPEELEGDRRTTKRVTACQGVETLAAPLVIAVVVTLDSTASWHQRKGKTVEGKEMWHWQT